MIGNDYDARTFTVLLDEVLERLNKGKGEHAQIVEEAQAEFRREVIARMEVILNDARMGRTIKTSVDLPVPVSHLNVYDNAIMTLEMTKRAGATTVELTADEVERFCRNKWSWTRHFLDTNANYSNTARLVNR